MSTSPRDHPTSDDHIMSQTSATPQNESDKVPTTAMDLPPVLKLPVELRYLIYSYATDEQQWFAPDSEQIKPLPLGKNRFGQRHFRKSSNRTLFHRQRAFLTTNTIDPHKAKLTCAHPLARVNRQFRIEFSEFLRTSSMSIVSRVRDFDFSHVQHFLSTLEEVHQNTFKVRNDGNFSRKLIIELQGPYTTYCMENLQYWIEYVNAFVGPELRGELCTLYKTIDSDDPKRAATPMMDLPLSRHSGDDLHRRIPITVLKDVLEYYGKLAPGGGEVEVHKIMRTLYCRLGMDWMYKQEHVAILRSVSLRFGSSSG